MKIKIVVSIICLGILNVSYASQDVIQSQLSDPSEYIGLSPDMLGEAFVKYIFNSKTVPSLYRQAARWKKVSKEFNSFAALPKSKKTIVQKEASILKEISQQLSIRGFSSTKLDVYILSLNPASNKKFDDIIIETHEKTAARIARLDDILGLTLAQVALKLNNLGLMQLLVVNGANVNYFESHTPPEAKVIPIATYAGITPLDSAIAGTLSRLAASVRAKKDLSAEFIKIQYLISKGAKVNFVSAVQEPTSQPTYETMSYLGMIVTYMSFYNHNVGYDKEFTDAIMRMMSILLDAGAKITPGVEAIAKSEKQMGHPELSDLLSGYLKK